jgi:SsrA-binding protein
LQGNGWRRKGRFCCSRTDVRFGVLGAGRRPALQPFRERYGLPGAVTNKPWTEEKLVCVNRKARFEYEILETFEGGLVLRGTEVKRKRKILLHKREIAKLTGKIKERGLSVIPLKIYFKNGMAKVELGLGRGKKIHDKRETIKNRDALREAQRETRARVR